MVALTKKGISMAKTKNALPGIKLSDVADSFHDDFLIIDSDHNIILANLVKPDDPFLVTLHDFSTPPASLLKAEIIEILYHTSDMIFLVLYLTSRVL